MVCYLPVAEIFRKIRKERKTYLFKSMSASFFYRIKKFHLVYDIKHNDTIPNIALTKAEPTDNINEVYSGKNRE